MNIPSQYNQVMPYLIIPNASGFIAFMVHVFGAVEQLQVPRTEGVIMHGELRIGGSVIMFADSTEEFSPRPAGMFIYVDNVDEVYARAMAEGAVTTMPPMKMDYGYTCGFKDPFGNDWWPTQAPG